MRILLTHVYAWPEVRRGGERYLHELGATLVEAGHQVTIVTTSPQPGRSVVLGVPVVSLPRRPWLRRYREQSTEACFGVEVLVRRALSRIDVWHALGTADGAAAGVLSRLRPGVRSVYTDLGNPMRSWRESRPDAGLHRRIVSSASSVDEYVCLSSYSAGFLARDYGRVARVIGGGVDIRRFTPGVRADTPTLLFSGAADDSRKNLPLLLDAVGVLVARGRRVRLVVCGPGALSLARTPSSVRDVTSVLGVGAVEDLPRLYGEAWATVLPSSHEAFGLALVESLACGTPIVALAEGGGPAELVTPAIGALSGSSPEALADACEAALDLAARGQVTVDACRSAAALHDWRSAVVPQVEMAYRGGR